MNRNTTATRKPRLKPARTAELVIRPDASAPGAVTIGMGKLERAYLVSPLPSDFGRAFRLEKIADGMTYDVCLDGTASTCECKGFLHHRHCKHVDTLAELASAGRL